MNADVATPETVEPVETVETVEAAPVPGLRERVVTAFRRLGRTRTEDDAAADTRRFYRGGSEG